MVRGRPIVLDNGDYLLPIYHETGRDPERVGADSQSEFLHSIKRPEFGSQAAPFARQREHPSRPWRN